VVDKEDQEEIETETTVMNFTNHVSAGALSAISIATPADTGIVSSILVFKML